MQITRRMHESDADFARRAFRFNRLVGKVQCNCNQGRLPCSCENSESMPGPARPFIQATRVDIKSLINDGYLMPVQPVSRMSRLRAIWYGSLLFAAGALVATAVFGMGQ